jgi:hypothetical protein
MKTNNLVSRNWHARVIVLFMWAVAASHAFAASDTDVTIIKAESVVIEKDKITIIGEAITKMRLITGDYDPKYKGTQLFGRPAAFIKVKSDKATFIIHKPKNGPKIWHNCVKAAKALAQGKPVNRIAYYEPDVTIKKNKITRIDGNGFLLP